MNTRTTRHLLALWLVAGLSLLSGCKEEVSIPAGAFDENPIDLRGEWQISRVFRNDQDVTQLFDFSGLKLVLQMDENGPTSYTLDHGGTPFVVLQNGTWALDDKVYPTAMLFTAGNEEETVLFTSPPISGNPSLSISFSLGCNDNSYTYELVKP